jgi:tyrosyl-tRNA synthetase
LLREWLELLTDRPAEEVRRLTDPAATHPMEAKKLLGRDIVGFYHGEAAAVQAQAEWEKQVSRGEDPTDMAEAVLPRSELTDGKVWICKLLVLVGLAKSNNEARRHVEGKAVTIGPDRQKVTDPKAEVTVTDGLIVRVGSRADKVVRIRVH